MFGFLKGFLKVAQKDNLEGVIQDIRTQLIKALNNMLSEKYPEVSKLDSWEAFADAMRGGNREAASIFSDIDTSIRELAETKSTGEATEESFLGGFDEIASTASDLLARVIEYHTRKDIKDTEESREGARSEKYPFFIIKTLGTQDNKNALYKAVAEEVDKQIQDVPIVSQYMSRATSTKDPNYHLVEALKYYTKANAHRIIMSKDNGILLKRYLEPNAEELAATMKGNSDPNNVNNVRVTLNPIVGRMIAAEMLRNLESFAVELLGMDLGEEAPRILTKDNKDSIAESIIVSEKEKIRDIKQQLNIHEDLNTPAFFFEYGAHILFTKEGRELFLGLWKQRKGSSGNDLVSLFQSRVLRVYEEKGEDPPEGAVLKPEYFNLLASAVQALNSRSNYQVLYVGKKAPLLDFLFGIGQGVIKTDEFSVIALSDFEGMTVRRDMFVHDAIIFLGATGLFPKITPVTASAQWKYQVGIIADLKSIAKKTAEKTWFAAVIEAIMYSDSPLLDWLQEVIKVLDDKWEVMDLPLDDVIKAAETSINTASKIYTEKTGTPPTVSDTPKEDYLKQMQDKFKDVSLAFFTPHLLRRAQKDVAYYNIDQIIGAILKEFKGTKRNNLTVNVTQMFAKESENSYVLYSFAFEGLTFQNTSVYTFDLPTAPIADILENPEELLAGATRLEGKDIYVVEKKTAYDGDTTYSYVTVLVPFKSIFKPSKSTKDSPGKAKVYFSTPYEDYSLTRARGTITEKTDVLAERGAVDPEALSKGREALRHIDMVLDVRLVLPGYKGRAKNIVLSLMEEGRIDELAGMPEIRYIFSPLMLLRQKISRRLQGVTDDVLKAVVDYTTQLRKFITEVSDLTKNKRVLIINQELSLEALSNTYLKIIGNTFDTALEVSAGLSVSPVKMTSDDTEVNSYSYVYGETTEKPMATAAASLMEEIGSYSDYFKYQQNIGYNELEQVRSSLYSIYNDVYVPKFAALKSRLSNIKTKRRGPGFFSYITEAEKIENFLFALLTKSDTVDVRKVTDIYKHIGKVLSNISGIDPKTGVSDNPATLTLNAMKEWITKAGAPLQMGLFVSQLDSLKNDIEASDSLNNLKEYAAEFKRLKGTVSETTGNPPKQLLIDFSKRPPFVLSEDTGDVIDSIFSEASFLNPEHIRTSLNYADRTMNIPNVSTGTVKIPYIKPGNHTKEEVIRNFSSAKEMADKIPLRKDMVEEIRNLLKGAVGLIVNIREPEFVSGGAATSAASPPEEPVGEQSAWVESMWDTANRIFSQPGALDDPKVRSLKIRVERILKDLETGVVSITQARSDPALRALFFVDESGLQEGSFSDRLEELYGKTAPAWHEDIVKEREKEYLVRMEKLKQERVAALKALAESIGVKPDTFITGGLFNEVVQMKTFMELRASKLGISLNPKLPKSQLAANWDTVTKSINTDPPASHKFRLEKAAHNILKQQDLDFPSTVKALESLFGTAAGFTEQAYLRAKDPNWEISYINTDF